jgi:hypothetical protein
METERNILNNNMETERNILNNDMETTLNWTTPTESAFNNC